MPSATDFIQDACEKLGVYAPGEAISTDDASRGLAELNAMVSAWRGERIPIYQLLPTTFTMTAGQWSYTIGSANQADIASQRPDRILEGVGAASVVLAGVTTLVDVIGAAEWDAFCANIDPDYTDTPGKLSYDPDFPLGLLRFSPPPSGAFAATFSVMTALASFADLTTNYTMPPIEESAIKYNLAGALKPYFSNATVAPEIAALAAQTKRELRRLNRLSRAARQGDGPSPVPPRPSGPLPPAAVAQG